VRTAARERAVAEDGAPGPPGPADGWATLRALAELRWRLLLRRLRGPGGVPEMVARFALYVIAIPAGLAFAALASVGAFQAVRAGRGLQATVPIAALFFGVWQTWTLVALSISERDALDLRRFLVYPIPPRRIFGYGLAASLAADPFAAFWCLLLAGTFAGAAAARPGAWLVLLALVLVAFVAATVAVVALLQELLARLLRGRRARELLIASVYVSVAVLLAWTAGHAGALLPLLRGARTLRWLAYPAALAEGAVRELYAGRALAALPWLVALVAAVIATVWAAYRLALAAAREGSAGAPRAAATGESGWRLPGRIGALVEKEAKYLLRHPIATLLALILPPFAALVAWKIPPRLPAGTGEIVRVLPVLGFALYAHMAAQVFWLNAFGWERGGGRTWFLAPVAPAEVLLAKNLAAYGLSAGLFFAAAAAAVAVGGALPGWALAAAVALHAGIAPWILAAGNFVSVLNPRPAANTVQRGGSLSPLSSLAGMFIVSGAAAAFAVPVVFAIRRNAPWLLVWGWAALGVAGGIAYRIALPFAARLLVRRREPLLAAVAGDEE
jgi:ABC-2 type transport system permease protein